MIYPDLAVENDDFPLVLADVPGQIMAPVRDSPRHDAADPRVVVVSADEAAGAGMLLEEFPGTRRRAVILKPVAENRRSARHPPRCPSRAGQTRGTAETSL
ncbi:MAG: hypothetical protein OXF88_01695 [Rhodobacteraceae bacterium]|nr:hypothetical protein [Paracoccaceae bacterium]MCY4140612.1 hypothetical protein [Paracoccaceae bacterium]